MEVSIIIPTYNRKSKLKYLLDDIAFINHPDVKEVFVCDDGSSEDIESMIKSVSFSKPIYYLRQENLGFRAGQARNMGIKLAKGDILLFMDDDVKISTFYIDAHIAKHKEAGNKALVFGFRYRSHDEPDNILLYKQPKPDWIKDSRVAALKEDGSDLANIPHPWFYVYSCNFSLRNNPDMPLFDPTFTGWGMEDIEYAYRLHHIGYKICFEKNAWLLHIESKKPRDPFRCEELEIEKNYDTYISNCVRFLQKYPNDTELHKLLKKDLRWYLQDENGRWIKNGHLNSFENVMAQFPEGVPVNDDATRDIATEFMQHIVVEKPIHHVDPALYKRKLDEIAIELTVYCNLKCKMCSVWEIREHGINTERTKEILNEAYSLGARTFIPCGAESFMRKDFLEIVKYADAIGFTNQEIVTNGLLINDKHINILKDIPSVSFHISIDGPPHIHDNLRGKGNYDKAMKILTRLKENKIKFGVSSVIMRETLPFLRHIIDLANHFELDEISMQPFQYEISGRHKDTDRFSFLKKQAPYLIYELNELNKYAKKKNVKIFTESLFNTIPDYLINGNRPIPPQGCHMPSRFMLINWEGNVYPCFFMRQEVMGNVHHDSLKNIWHKDIHNKMQELGLKKLCPGCLAACSDIASFNESQLKSPIHA